MTDQELSTMLQEWPPTAAPATLEERVFGPRPLPVPWWGRVPAGPLAALGTAVGALLMLLLFTLVQSEPAVTPPAPPVKQTVVPEPPPPVPQPAPKRRSAPKPRSAPVVSSVPVTQPAILTYGPMPDSPGPLTAVMVVRLRVHIAKDGRVIGADVIEGDPQLSAIAIEAVKQWRYRPELVSGEPAESSNEVNVTFGPRPRPAKPRR